MSQKSWRSFFAFVLRYSWYVHYQGMIKERNIFHFFMCKDILLTYFLYVRPQAYLLVCDNVALYNCNGRIIWEVTLLVVLLCTVLELKLIPDICTTQNQSYAPCVRSSLLCSTWGTVYFWFCNWLVLWILKEKLHGYVTIFSTGYLG